MKLALAFLCLGLIALGVMDLEPFRPSRGGRARSVRAKAVPREQAARRRRLPSP